MSGGTVDVDSADVWPEDAEDVEEAVVSNWFVREGGRVEEGSTIAEIQIEKVSVDVPAPAGGEVVDVLVPEGGEFARGDVLGRIRAE
ncbi:lipoyl domain-containing protein [Haladaptatus salinisoli]|uniref:lipoyl domain-containing protein n=1 Tax=Haladaptatus salinisoli TaxID=2884876 RepID=UPI001D09C624|nr:lipoyl domain-containing protein [Haladaptatus salinisoli]